MLDSGTVADGLRCIHVHIPKTGGSSINSVLGLDGDGHFTAKQLKMRLGNLRWRAYFKFCFVRNPWDRMVSYYYFHRAGRGGPSARRIIRFCESHTFEEFLFEYLNKDIWQGPQLAWMKSRNGKVEMDFIGRFENLADDFGLLCRHLDIEPVTLPHSNKTTHRDYEHCYSDASRRLVAEKHRVDIEQFGYRFGE